MQPTDAIHCVQLDKGGIPVEWVMFHALPQLALRAYRNLGFPFLYTNIMQDHDPTQTAVVQKGDYLTAVIWSLNNNNKWI